MFRKLLLSSILIAGFSGMALAKGGDTNIEQFAESQPHSAAISSGTPVIVDNQHGEPVIAYHDQTRQSFSAGIPVIVGNQDGQPVIRYEQGDRGRTVLADNGDGSALVQLN